MFRVLEQSIVTQQDGSSVTFKRVAPPRRLWLAPVPVAPPSAAELARQQELDAKEAVLLSISASVNAQGLTVLRWSGNGSQVFHAVSNVDFQCLAGLGSVETAESFYTLVMGVGTADELEPEAAAAASVLPADGTPTCALLPGSEAGDTAGTQALKGMEELMHYFASHREELVARRAVREAEARARELALRNAPPSPPRRSVVHFWPLQPAQRAAIKARASQGGANP